MKKFWVELPTEICLALERAAVEAKAAGRFGNVKKGGKKAMAELLLTEWFQRESKRAASTGARGSV
jgi:hypothetical protein